MNEKKTVLVAEDDDAMRSVICFGLVRAGFDVTPARDGSEAWQLVSNGSFDLLVTDYQMPGMTGGELSQRIRDDARLSGLPIILLTAKVYELDTAGMIESLKLNRVMAKPYSPRELREAAEDCIARVPAGV